MKKIFILLSLFALSLNAQEKLKANIAQLPVLADSQDKGLLVELVKALGKASGAGIDYKVLPFNKSLNETLQGAAHFHVPLLLDPVAAKTDRGFRYSDVTLWNVVFALYTNKNKRISASQLAGANIETEMTHVHFFSGVNPSSDIVQSLKRVNEGKLDGFIFAALECDEIIKREQLSQLESQHFRTFEVKFIVPKGGKGEATNKRLTAMVEKIKVTGDFEKIMSPITSFYNSWKPNFKN